MQVWQLQKAKAKLSELMNNAKSAPQIISRHGVHEAIILSMDTYKKLVGKKTNIITCLRNSPLVGLDLDLTRDSSLMRDMEL